MPTLNLTVTDEYSEFQTVPTDTCLFCQVGTDYDIEVVVNPTAPDADVEGIIISKDHPINIKMDVGDKFYAKTRRYTEGNFTLVVVY